MKIAKPAPVTLVSEEAMKLSMLPAWLLTRSRSLSFTTSEPKFCCRSVSTVAGPALQQLHVLRNAAEQQADLLEDQRVEQQREQQHNGEQGQDHQQRRKPAA